MNASIPLRKECPPGACVCRRDELLADPHGDSRILMLTREEEKKLIARIESISTLDELRRMEAKMHALLGISVRVEPGANEVRTVRGFTIHVEDKPGLCQKIRQSIPAAIRRCLERNPDISYALLNAHDLLGDA